ncbi:MAG TPA: lytic transglycosylase domain-containing protein [Rhizomicrobium sp.]|jgi:soluble lytic murein transglycosylase-like protein|nr:lytic transglycosylase domain-containing protein [Rhizomicrobium sp.]
MSLAPPVLATRLHALAPFAAAVAISAAIGLGIALWLPPPGGSQRTVITPPAVHRLAIKKPAAPKPQRLAAAVKPAPKPSVPSAFALEQAMNTRQRMERWTPFIQEASRRYALSGQWIRAVMLIESGGRTMLDENRKIISTAGAMGLMQLMPETWREMRAQLRLGTDPYDPHDNVMAGAAYLSGLYKQYGYPTMFAAYNDGPGMLAAHAALNQALPVETENYVRDIASILGTGVRYRAGGKKNLAQLTRPDGTAVMVDAGSVIAVRAALPGEYAPSVQSVISIGRMRQGVREPPAKATAVLRAHGGLI